MKASFTGVALTVRCPDPALAAALTPAARSWASRTGATVTVKAEPMAPGDDTDVGVIAAAELGAWAEREELAPVPAALRAVDHPFRWGDILPPYREQLIEWGGQARAIPLAGDGFVVVYRADRLADAKFAEAFRRRFAREPVAPTSWEEFADLAAAFAEFDGRPSLPPTTREDAADLFFRVAACYDRPVLKDAKVGAGAGVLAFQHDPATGDPRLGTTGFVAAADWLAGLSARKCLPPQPSAPSDPAAALAKNEAALAVLSLAQLAKLPREGGAVPPRFALTSLPGTRSFVDPDKRQLVPSGTPNSVPYLAGGRFGVVRTRCANADAAFDLLVELGGPTRSLEVLATPGLGAGPFRSAHLDRDRLSALLGYGFDAERSKALQEVLRQYVRPEVKNAAAGLRGPDQAALAAAAAEELGKIAAGTASADAGLKALTAVWNRIDEKTPKDVRLRWRKFAVGVK